MLYKLKNPHSVSQIGYCSDGQEFIFVYDYVPRGTLYHHLHKGGRPLSWVRRLKIWLQTARGLEYLHSETSMVLHLDVKSLNILLASNWEAKLSDFGLSIVRPIDSAYYTKHERGTDGYLDPHVYMTGEFSRKTDVFAFGVVMFEVLCQKTAYPKSIDGKRQFLRAWALESIKNGRLKQIIDPNLEGRISSKCLEEFAKLAHKCLHDKPEKRPTMEMVVNKLEYILTLQENSDMLSNQENSARGITLKSLDKYLYTIGGVDHIVPHFNLDALAEATENFSDANKISSDDGCRKFMYKGRLNIKATTIAKFFEDTYVECKNEASFLVGIENENVIQLLGHCIDGTNVYLLYDFACNATLGGLLFDPWCNVLNWDTRYKIILAAARELAYFHHHAPIQIIHGDVRPENILLDRKFDSKLSGFGFAVADNVANIAHLHSHYGAIESIASRENDVFGFGMLVLNSITGQKAGDTDKNWHLHYVRRNWLEGTLLDIIDPKINGADSTLMIKSIEIGLLCVQGDAKVRPTMEEVVELLLDTLPLTPLELEMRARTTDWKDYLSRRISARLISDGLIIDSDTSEV